MTSCLFPVLFPVASETDPGAASLLSSSYKIELRGRFHQFSPLAAWSLSSFPFAFPLMEEPPRLMRVGSNFRWCLLDLNRNRITPSWLFGLSSLLRGLCLPALSPLVPPLQLSVMSPMWFFSVTARTSRSAPSPPPCACTQRHARSQTKQDDRTTCAGHFPFTRKNKL